MKKLVISILVIIFTISLALVIQSTIEIFSQKNRVNKTLQSYEQTVQEEPIPLAVKDLSKQKKVVPEETQVASYPEKGDIIGKIIFPTLGEVYPIIEGTEEEQLARGVGHYLQSVLPGRSDNSVLAGHRDGVFKNLGKLRINDTVKIEMGTQVWIYKITKQQIVDDDDRTIIVPHDQAVLTLVSCYPFDFIGPAPKRYILTAVLEE